MNKIFRNLWILKALLPSLFLCLYHLPFKQAIKCPILIYKPKYRYLLKGKIIINGKIHFGMIQLGRNKIPFLPNTGCKLINNGVIIFNGDCFIGNGSAINVGKHGRLSFGENFCATATFKAICYHNITFDRQVLVGWDCYFMDTDLHSITKINGKMTKGYKPISIGSNSWIGMGVTILKGINLPDHIIVAAKTTLRKIDFAVNPYSLICSNSEPRILREGIFRDYNNDEIIYPSET